MTDAIFRLLTFGLSMIFIHINHHLRKANYVNQILKWNAKHSSRKKSFDRTDESCRKNQVTITLFVRLSSITKSRFFLEPVPFQMILSKVNY